ncbi:MAG: hypothetical protein WCS70_04180 [Verrucomicrobiota bacterium]
MKAILIILVIVAVFYVGAQALTVYKVKDDLAKQTQHYLDFVDEKSMADVKRDLAAEAKKLGITLSPDNIYITYEDTDIQSMAQRIVGRKLGAQYSNKRVVITVRYTAHIALLPLAQEVSEFKIVQVAAPVIPANKQAQELLDTP